MYVVEMNKMQSFVVNGEEQQIYNKRDFIVRMLCKICYWTDVIHVCILSDSELSVFYISYMYFLICFYMRSASNMFMSRGVAGFQLGSDELVCEF